MSSKELYKALSGRTIEAISLRQAQYRAKRSSSGQEEVLVRSGIVDNGAPYQFVPGAVVTHFDGSRGRIH